jgi:hypothetical protein
MPIKRPAAKASLAMPLEGRAGFAGAAACCAARPLKPGLLCG